MITLINYIKRLLFYNKLSYEIIRFKVEDKIYRVVAYHCDEKYYLKPKKIKGYKITNGTCDNCDRNKYKCYINCTLGINHIYKVK